MFNTVLLQQYEWVFLAKACCKVAFRRVKNPEALIFLSIPTIKYLIILNYINGCTCTCMHEQSPLISFREDYSQLWESCGMSTPKHCGSSSSSYPGEYCYRSSVFSSLYPMDAYIHKVVLSPIDGLSLIVDCKWRHWVG